MKINIITYNNQYGLTGDVNVLKYLLKRYFRDRVEIYAVNFFDYKCNYADINIFVETVSNILFKYAPINVLIPNQEWYYRTWIPYINKFDRILVKTGYAKKLFENIIEDKSKVRYISWRSPDRYNSDYNKDYTKYLHVCGKSKHKQTQLLINTWKPDMPHLTVVYSPKDVQLIHNNLDNITYIRERLSDKDLVELMNTCGVHICCSDTEGFGHYIHEAKSCKAVVITTGGFPMCSYFDDEVDGFLVSYRRKKRMKLHLGSKYIFNPKDLIKVVNKIQELQKNNPKKLISMGNKARKSFISTCGSFSRNFKKEFYEIMGLASKNKKANKQKKKDESEKMKEMIKDENLPAISIITPTYNRRHMFELALLNWNNLRYPEDKVEWIIVDDGEDKIYDLIPQKDKRVKYYAIDKKVNVGQKRNLCVGFASNDIIVSMDDDDYYPFNSFKLRVLELLKSGKKCVTCTTIGCFHINKLISMVNVPPHQLPFSERVSEASMCFYKSFWEERPFNNKVKYAEGKHFLEGRLDDCLEISWEGVIVALLHNRNTSDKITMSDTPNGCHFGWSDELFLFITNLEKDLSEEEERKVKKQKNKLVRN